MDGSRCATRPTDDAKPEPSVPATPAPATPAPTAPTLAAASSGTVPGQTYVGGLLAQRGYASVPSPDAPGPLGASYFDGGYDTARHGCRDGGAVCGIQAELPFERVRDTDANRQRFAGQLARVLMAYAQTNAGSER